MSLLHGWAIFFGLLLGLGLWSVVGALPRLSRPRLADRVAPYIVDVSEHAREYVQRQRVEPLPVIGTLFAPSLAAARRRISSLVGGNESTALRLRQAAVDLTVEEFRGRQLAWAGVGLVAGLAAVALGSSRAAFPIGAQVGLPIVAAVSGFFLRDWFLQRTAKRRLAQIESEFPTVVEFLTLSLAAGEGALDALRRVARVSSGELSREFATVLAEVDLGVPLAQALHSLARGLRLTPVTRCVDAVTAALESGSPLAAVLRAQGQDARDEAKRALLEAAGKKEVTMLVPLVFLILPTTVLYAIFPGIFVLQAGF